MTLPTPYYERDGVVIYLGDCREILPSLTDASFVVLDPPYSMVPNAFAGRDDGAAGTCATPVRLLSETLKETRRLLPEGGAAALICDWRRMPDVAYLASREGLRLSTCLAWTRKTAGMGSMFRSAWDPVLILSVGSPDVRDKSGVRNVIEVNKPRGGEHPYEKPVELWDYVLRRVPSGLVVDPFSGTGSSLVAATRHGHKCIGIEIEEKYCEIAVRRLSQQLLPFGEANR